MNVSHLFSAVALLLVPTLVLGQGLVGDTIEVQVNMSNLSDLALERPDSTVVTTNSTDQLIFGEGATLSINPDATSITMLTEGSAFAVGAGSFIEFTNLDIPFQRIVGASITSSSGSITPVITVTNDAVRLDFPDWGSSFYTGVTHTVHLDTTNTVGSTPASQMVENDLLTNAPNAQFRAYFTEAVQLFDADDLELTLTGTLTTNGPVVVTGSNAIYTIVVPVSGDGTVRIDLKDGSDVTTKITTQSIAMRIPSRPVAIDQTPPMIVSQTPSSAPLESGNAFSVALVYSEEVIGASRYSLTNLLSNVRNLDRFGTVGYLPNSSTTATYTITVELIDPDLPGSLETGILAAGHGIRDRAGNALSPVPPLLLTTVIRNGYQQWVVDTGLTDVLGKGYADDGDLDGLDNFTEYMRNRDPLQANEEPRSLFHVVDFDGTQHAVLTVAAPDDYTYETEENLEGGKGGPYHYIEAQREINGYSTGEYIEPSLDLSEFGDAAVLIEEVTLPALPAALPSLDPGWSYHHFRFQQSIDELPSAFMLFDVFHPDD